MLYLAPPWLHILRTSSLVSKTDSPHSDFQKAQIAGFETDETHYNNLLIYALSRPTLFSFAYIVGLILR